MSTAEGRSEIESDCEVRLEGIQTYNASSTAHIMEWQTKELRSVLQNRSKDGRFKDRRYVYTRLKIIYSLF